MVEMGLKKRQLILGAEPTIQALPEANYSEVKTDPYSRQTTRIWKWATELRNDRGEVKPFEAKRSTVQK